MDFSDSQTLPSPLRRRTIPKCEVYQVSTVVRITIKAVGPTCTFVRSSIFRSTIKCFEDPLWMFAMKDTRLVEESFMDPPSGQRTNANAVSVKRFLLKNNIPVKEHHPMISFSSQKSSLRSKEPGSNPWMQWMQKRRISDKRLASNTGHGQSNRRAWMKLCVTVEGSQHVNVPPSSSSSEVIKSIRFFYYHTSFIVLTERKKSYACLRPHGRSENFYGDRNWFEVIYVYLIQGVKK